LLITATAGSTSGTISVVAENGCGSSPAQNLFVTIEQPPGQPGSISGAFVLCPGAGDVYVVAAVNGATSYTWTLPQGWTGASTTNTIVANCGNSGVIEVTADNACGSSPPQSLPVNVLSPPDVNVTQSGGQLTAAQNGASYQWLDCNGFTPIVGETAQVFEPTVNGNYAVVVTLNGCSDTSNCINVSFSGLGEPTEKHAFTIFPNPTTGSISLQAAFGIHSVEITNALGERVFVQSTSGSALVVNLQTDLPSGLYFVRINGLGEALRIAVE
jgi:hypothetical protein